MSANLFACVFWLEENQYSVVPATDIVEGSTVKEGDEAVVAWRFCKKNKVHTSWYKAKIIKYSAYLLACARSLNVPPIEPAKLRKMFTNKCTTAKAKKKQLLSLQ